MSIRRLFSWFESRLAPFPDDGNGKDVTAPPDTLWKFCWYYSKDALPWLLAMSFLSAVIAVVEVMLFGFLGQVVDWLSVSDREDFIQREGRTLLLMGVLVVFILPLTVLVASLITHQTLLGNFPMAARWRMHRLLLGQSLAFFSDEFAGRITTKVMQTALAVREAVMKLLDILVYVMVYFLTMLALVASADWRLAIPLVIWLCIYISIVGYFVPRLRATAERQADARSQMTLSLIHI